MSASVAEVIGATPLVILQRLVRTSLGGQAGTGGIFAKLDYLNPGFSKKDRVARQMVDEARSSGDLMPGQPVVELTSGNTGTGLAIVCSVRGHPFYAVMSRGNSVERARMMRALGAHVVLVDQAPASTHGQVSGEDLRLVEAQTQELSRSLGAFRADQFVLEASWRAHYAHTGPELVAQTAAWGGIDCFVDFVGSGGTFRGVSQFLKEVNPATQCYVVEPAGCPVLAAGDGTESSNPNHRIQGGGYSKTHPELSLMRAGLVDGYLAVTDSEAVQMARRLAAEEGIFGGFSAGANVHAALHLLTDKHKGQNVACLVCDSGLKYLSTDLYDREPFA